MADGLSSATIARLGVDVDADRATTSIAGYGRASSVTADQVDRLERSLASAARALQQASSTIAGQGSSIAGASRQIAEYSQNTDRAADATRTHTSTMQTAESAADRLSSTLRNVGIALGVREIIAYADAWTLIQGRLSLVSGTADIAISRQRQLLEIANATRTDLTATADIYNRMARNQQQLGATGDDLLRVTRSINESFIVSGASTEAQTAALIQLGQAFASGALRGDELRSVLEQAPRLAQAIAQGMGVTVGELRKLGEAGALTAKSVFDALKGQGDAIDAEFSKMPVTVSQSFTVLRNEVQRFIGEQSQATGATRLLADGIVGLAHNLGEVATAAELVAVVFGARWLAGAADRTSGFLASLSRTRAETVAYQEDVLRSATASRAEAEATLQGAQAKRVDLEATRAAIVAERELAVAKLQSANTRLARAVDPASLAPLGGAVVAREEAAQAAATKQRSDALRDLAVMGTQQANVERELAAVTTLETEAAAAATAATRAQTVATEGLTVASRAGAAAMGLLEGALALVGGPVGLLLIGTFAAMTLAANTKNEAMKRLSDSLDSYQKKLKDVSAEEVRAQLEADKTALAQSQAMRQRLDAEIGASKAAFGTGGVGFNAAKTGVGAEDPAADLKRRRDEAVASEQVLAKQIEILENRLTSTGQSREQLNEKARATIAVEQAELEKLTALNDAYGRSQLALKILEIQFDATTAKSRFAAEHMGADQAALRDRFNEVTDAITRQKIIAAQNADTMQEFSQLAGKASEMLERLKPRDALTAISPELTKIVEQPLKDLERLERETAALGKRNAKETTDELAASLSIYKQTNAEAEKLSRTLETQLLRAIISVATTGTRSFSDFFSTIERGAAQIGDSIAASIARQQELLKQADTTNAKQISARIADLAKLAAITGTITAAASGGIIGFNIGQQTSSGFNGAGAGAVTGAVAGFQSAGPIGALIGGFTGAIGGLLGAADAHRKAAKALEDAGHSLATNIAAYSESNPVARAIAENAEKQRQLIDQAKAVAGQRLAEAGKTGDKGAAESAIKQLQDDLAAIEKGRGANFKRIADDFWNGIYEQLNRLDGPAGDLKNSLAELERQWNENRASALALGSSTTLVDELYQRQKKQLEDAFAESQRQRSFATDAREARAGGSTLLAGEIERRASVDAERFKAEQENWSDADKERLVYIEGLENERDALRAVADAQQAFLEAVSKGPTGSLSTQLEAELAPLASKLAQDQRDYADAVKLLSDDLASGADEATIAADKNRVLAESIAVAGDQAAITATEFQSAVAKMAQAQNDIQRDISLGFKTPEQGRAAEAQAFGFGGLTDDQIRALYTVFNGTALTNEQEQTNKNIEQFFRDFPTTVSGIIAGAPESTATSARDTSRDAITNAAGGITRADGNRMADVLTASLVLEREQLLTLRDIRDGVIGRPISGASFFGAPSSIASPAPAAPISLSQALASTPGTRPAINLTMPIRVVAADGSDAEAFARAIVRITARLFDTELGNEFAAAQVARGETTRNI